MGRLTVVFSLITLVSACATSTPVEAGLRQVWVPSHLADAAMADVSVAMLVPLEDAPAWQGQTGRTVLIPRDDAERARGLVYAPVR